MVRTDFAAGRHTGALLAHLRRPVVARRAAFLSPVPGRGGRWLYPARLLCRTRSSASRDRAEPGRHIWRMATATASCAVTNRPRSGVMKPVPTPYVPSPPAVRDGTTTVRHGRVAVEKRLGCAGLRADGLLVDLRVSARIVEQAAAERGNVVADEPQAPWPVAAPSSKKSARSVRCRRRDFACCSSPASASAAGTSPEAGARCRTGAPEDVALAGRSALTPPGVPARPPAPRPAGTARRPPPAASRDVPPGPARPVRPRRPGPPRRPPQRRSRPGGRWT